MWKQICGTCRSPTLWRGSDGSSYSMRLLRNDHRCTPMVVWVVTQQRRRYHITREIWNHPKNDQDNSSIHQNNHSENSSNSDHLAAMATVMARGDCTLPSSSLQQQLQQPSLPLSPPSTRPNENHFHNGHPSTLNTGSSSATHQNMLHHHSVKSQSSSSSPPPPPQSTLSQTTTTTATANNHNNTNTDAMTAIATIQSIFIPMDQLLHQKPIGTFDYPNDYIASRHVIERMIRQHHQPLSSTGSSKNGRTPRPTNTAAMVGFSALWTTVINTTLQLLERNVKEYSLYLALQPPTPHPTASHNNPSVLWFSQLQFINTIYRCWKDMALWHLKNNNKNNSIDNKSTGRRNGHGRSNIAASTTTHNNANRLPPNRMNGAVSLLSPRQLVQSLEQMSILLPIHFHFNITTMNLLLTVLIQQAPTKQMAPQIAEQLLDFIRAHSDSATSRSHSSNNDNDGNSDAAAVVQDGTHPPNQNSTFSMTPNADTYLIVIQAWIDSDLPETSMKINQLLNEFHTSNVLNSLPANESSSSTLSTSSSSSSSAANYLNESNHATGVADDIYITEGASQLSPYLQVIQYYGQRNHLQRIKAIYKMLEENPVLQSKMNYDSLFRIWGCAISAKDHRFIYHILPRLTSLLKENSKNNRHSINGEDSPHLSIDMLCSDFRNMFRVGTHELLRHYRDQMFQSRKLSNHQSADLLRAIFVHQCIKEYAPKDRRLIETATFAMFSIYSRSGNIELLEELVHDAMSKVINPKLYAMMIKTYSAYNLEDRADELIRRMMHKESKTKPTIITLNTLINCWAVSSTLEQRTVAAERAFSILYWMNSNQQCIDLNIKPNLVTFATLIKCITTSAVAALKCSNSDNKHIVNTSISERVETVLHELDERRKNGDASFKLHIGIYAGAVKALLIANNIQRAEEILQLMEELYQQGDNGNNPVESCSATDNTDAHILPLNTKMYVPFFKFYSRLQTTIGAQSAEELHNRMKQLYQERLDPNLKPNNTTYSLILTAWAESGETYSTKNIWRIYLQMLDELDIDGETYEIVVRALSSSTHGKDRHRLRHLFTNQSIANNRAMYMIALTNRMASGDIATVTYLMKLLIGSYIQQHDSWNTDFPDRSMFNWIISTYIISNELVSATLFLEDIAQLVTAAVSAIGGESLDVSWIGPDLKLILELRQAWTNSTTCKEKDSNVDKLDEHIIPAMVRLMGLGKSLIQPKPPQGKQPRVQQRQTSSAL